MPAQKTLWFFLCLKDIGVAINVKTCDAGVHAREARMLLCTRSGEAKSPLKACQGESNSLGEGPLVTLENRGL